MTYLLKTVAQENIYKSLEFFSNIIWKCQRVQPVKIQNPESLLHNW